MSATIGQQGQHQIRLVALDLDGTLLTSDHRVSERSTRVLHEARGRGVRVVLATGKTPASDRAVLAPLALTGPGVYVQGLLVGDRSGSVLYERTLPDPVARQVIDLATAHQLTVVAYCGHEILCAERNPYTDRMIYFNEPTPRAVGSLHEIVGKAPIHKMIFVGETAQMGPLRAHLAPQMAGVAGLVQGHPSMLEVLPLGGSKGDGLRRLLAFLDIPPCQVLAIGDAENDLEMIALAGIGVAMGNAIPRLKDAADHIVATNDQDGVSEAIERFVLGG